MRLFRKDPPPACPKCGRSDGWGHMPYDGPGGQSESVSAPLSSAPIMTSRVSMGPTGKNVRLRYHCSNCGYEKAY